MILYGKEKLELTIKIVAAIMGWLVGEQAQKNGLLTH